MNGRYNLQHVGLRLAHLTPLGLLVMKLKLFKFRDKPENESCVRFDTIDVINVGGIKKR